MEGDPLADVLALASARCVRIGTLKAGGTWALNFPPPQKIKLTAVVKGNVRLPFSLIWKKDNSSPLVGKFVAQVAAVLRVGDATRRPASPS